MHELLLSYLFPGEQNINQSTKYDLYSSYEDFFNRFSYLINSKQNVIDTGNVFKDFYGEWLFDGEYITKNIDDKSLRYIGSRFNYLALS